MDDRPVLLAHPLLHQLAGLLIVLGDGPVIDGVEMPVVHADALVGFGDGELGDLLQGRLGGGGEGAGKEEQRDHQPRSHEGSFHRVKRRLD
jgi:hypothetical protein